MQLITEIRPLSSHVMSTLGSGLYVPLLIPTLISKERSDTVEVEVSWSGMTGGAGTNVVAARCRGFAPNSGVVFSGSPLAPTADMWNMGRVLNSRNFSGALQQNGDLIFSNTILAGRAVAQFMAAPGAPNLIDPIVIVSFILTTGSAFTGGALVCQRVSFYNSQLPA